MEQASFEDWIENVEAGLRNLKKSCTAIFVAGLSMGGTLSLFLAENHPDIKGIISINAATHMPALSIDYEKLSLVNTRFADGIGSDIKKAGMEELAYPKTPVKSMNDLIKLSKNARSNLSKITAPALILSSVVDHVVPPENSKEIYETISSTEKELVLLEQLSRGYTG